MEPGLFMVDETRLEQMAVQIAEHSFGPSSNQIKGNTGEDVRDPGLTGQSPVIKNVYRKVNMRARMRDIHPKTNTV